MPLTQTVLSKQNMPSERCFYPLLIPDEDEEIIRSYRTRGAVKRNSVKFSYWKMTVRLSKTETVMALNSEGRLNQHNKYKRRQADGQV